MHVRERRADGYHALESLFVFAEDGDILHARQRDDGVITLAVEGPCGAGLSGDDDNLVMRAARRLQAATGVTVGADIRLDKRLPVPPEQSLASEVARRRAAWLLQQSPDLF